MMIVTICVFSIVSVTLQLLLVKNVFFAVLPTPVSFHDLARGSPGDLWYESWCQNTKLIVRALPDGENRMILRSLVLTQYQRVIDRQFNVSCF